MAKLRWLVVISVVCALAALACAAPRLTSAASTAPSGAQAPTGALDACTILTQADAEGLFGGPAKTPPISSSVADTVFQCAYASQDAGDVAYLQTLSILIRRALSAAENDTVWAQAKSNAGGNLKAVTGLGDDAFFDTSLKQLNVKKGAYWVILSGRLPADKDPLTTLIPLAQTVMGRLP